MDGLDKKPTFGEIGTLAYENLSKEGWKLWLVIQAIMINERQCDLAASDEMVMLFNRQFKRFLAGNELETEYMEKLKLQDVSLPSSESDSELFYELK